MGRGREGLKGAGPRTPEKGDGAAKAGKGRGTPPDAECPADASASVGHPATSGARQLSGTWSWVGTPSSTGRAALISTGGRCLAEIGSASCRERGEVVVGRGCVKENGM